MYGGMQSVEFPVLRAATRRCEDEDRQPFFLSDTMKRLAAMKAMVPRTQQKMGEQMWKQLVDTPCSIKHSTSKVSRGYLKMKEIFTTCVIQYPSKGVHLCESPGGFIQATADGAPQNWNWCAISLDEADAPTPCYKLLPMNRGEYHQQNIYNLEECRRLLEEGAADLVTADGAYKVQHCSIEKDHFPLLLAQTQVALHALAPHGTFVLKFFEGGERNTLVLLACLTQLFDNVSLIKPTASRPTNSERYIVARDFLGGKGKPWTWNTPLYPQSGSRTCRLSWTDSPRTK